VLDSFALEVPLVTTAVPSHGPEIDYLEDGVNGVVVRETDNPAMYASAVARLLKDGNLRGKLVSGCRSSKDKYTVEEMAERFASGVRTALGQRL
ncbi:MAG: group 1 glycosyl transferase, partial [Chloroflexota bacterium]|nr:group 1 glycosyl transferase [Chloroflexota bacterium]